MRKLPLYLGLVIAVVMAMLSPSLVFAATTNVSITSTGFLPASITINVGDTVVWTNNDTDEHTATDDELTWDTDIIEAGGTASQVFNTAGTYTYSDTIDPTLTGTIIVQSSTATTATTSTTTTTTSTTASKTASKGGTTPAQPVSGVFETTLMVLGAGALLLGSGIYAMKKA